MPGILAFQFDFRTDAFTWIKPASRKDLDKIIRRCVRKHYFFVYRFYQGDDILILPATVDLVHDIRDRLPGVQFDVY